jgi:hypothetical protein
VLQALAGEGGGRALLRGAEVVVVPLHEGDHDLDTPEAVRAWRASRAEAPPAV